MSRYSQLAASFLLDLLLRGLLPVSTSPVSSCYGNSTTLDWYINAVGETPCMTYQKLRQICNSNYQTPSWPIDAYTDQCDDPLSTCCCNSITWSVRMLCINCQWDEFGTTDPGHSANPGAYYNYRWSSGTPDQGSYCGDGWNQTLPESVQLAVCQNHIQLEDFLYSIFWPDGSWNFPAFEQSAQAILASQTEQLSYCPSTTQSAQPTTVPNVQSAPPTTVPNTYSASPTTVTNTHSAPPTTVTNTHSGALPTSAPTTSSDDPQTISPPAGTPQAAASAGRKVNITAAVCGSLGGALGLVAFGAIIAMLRYRRRLRGTTAIEVPRDLPHNTVEGMPAGGVTPFLGRYEAVSTLENMSKGRLSRSPRAYGEEIMHPPVSSALADYGFGEEEGGPPMPLAPSALGMPGSQLRERDAGVALFYDSRLPPEYRTVYSG